MFHVKHYKVRRNKNMKQELFYEVQPVVCDYGVFCNKELIKDLILNNRQNAELICNILNADECGDCYKLQND